MASRRTTQNKVTVDRVDDTPKFDSNNRCTACGTHCKTSRSQLDHTIGQHLSDATPENRALKRPFICEHCGKGFAQEATLRCHINAKHTGEKPYRCEFPPCTAAAAYPSSMHRHMEACHGWLPKNPRKEREGKKIKKERQSDAVEWDSQGAKVNRQGGASRTVEEAGLIDEANEGHAGPSRTTRSTRRAAPYSKPARVVPNKPILTKTASYGGAQEIPCLKQESPRPIHPTHGAQPVQQKGFYYETQPSRYQQAQTLQYQGHYNNPYQQGYYDNAATTSFYRPAPSEYAPAPVYNAPAPVYNSPAPAYNLSAPIHNSPAPLCNPSMPILPPSAYGAYHPSNATYASSSTSNYASASSSSFYSTTAMDSFCSASSSSSTAPQLSATDIKFAGLSFSSTNAAHAVFYPATSDSSCVAQVNGSTPHQANVSCPLNANALSPLDACVSSPPVPDATSALENTPLASQEPLLDLSQETLLDLDHAHDSFMDPSQDSFMSLSQEQVLDFSQSSFMDPSQSSFMDPSQSSFVDPSQDFLFDFSQETLLDLTFADSFPHFDAPCNSSQASDATYNNSLKSGTMYHTAADSNASHDYSSPISGAPSNVSSSSAAPSSPYAQVFDEFLNSDAMA
ncbi:hypothetical protein K523DRAFT_362372 [Schizophyllum commune Tattone D]|nr:hypothetical protein K523DRAFT_362372 [Schizophyllum commune Tattone D]